MHRDKVEELKKVLQSKKEAGENKAQNSSSAVADPVSEQEIQKLQKMNGELEKKVKEAEAESKESNEKYIRLYAEFENYRKRALREKQEIIHFAQEQVLREFLQVLDDLERAVVHAEKSEDLKVLLEGVKLVEKNMLSLFEKFGLTPLKTVGQPFNPHFHEAMTHHESADHPPVPRGGDVRQPCGQSKHHHHLHLDPVVVLAHWRHGALCVTHLVHGVSVSVFR